MSTRTEDRLRAALQARAESLTAEDLRPLEVPAPARRTRRTVLWTAAAAAIAAVVAAPFLSGPAEQAPRPPAPDDPLGAVRMDVNGDGRDDLAWVSFDAAAHTYLLSVQLADGPTLTYQGLAQGPPDVVGAADVDGDHAAEVMVRVGPSTSRIPEFFRYDEDRLVRLDTPAATERVAGWSAGAPGNQFTVTKGRLYTWRVDPSASTDVQQVPFWSWEVRGQRLVPEPPQERCVTATNPLPTECGLVPSEVTQETTADLDGDAAPDDVRLTFVAADTTSAVDGFRVEADLSGGGSVAAEGPPGARPQLLNPLSLAGDERQQVLVQQSGGGPGTLALFGLARGGPAEEGLVLLRAPRQPLLGSGPDDRGQAYRWVASPGRLVTIATPDRPAGPVEGFEWRVRGAALVATPLRGQCLPAGGDGLPEPC